MGINFNLSKIINLNFLIIIFILSYNLYVRFITLKIVTEYEKLFIIFIFILTIIWSFYKSHIKTIVSFIFGFSFFLFGFRPYDVQSQIFETVVLMLSYYYLIDNFLNNNSKILNNTLKNILANILKLILDNIKVHLQHNMQNNIQKNTLVYLIHIDKLVLQALP